METRHILLKDTPNAKTGALFLENHTYYCHKNLKGEVVSSYQHRDVEENPEWFKKVDVDLEKGVYYIPTIEEFCVGFEFEMDAGTGWCNQIFPNPWWNDGGMGGIKTLKNCINGKNVRVKRIDKEDCLSLGLELKVWDNGSGYFQKGNYTIGIYGTNLFCTVGQNDYSNKIIRFSGELKNKSELRRILIQVGCV